MALSAASLFFMGFKDVFGVTDYQILCIGALVLGPLALFGDLLPSFARQRVRFERAPGEAPPTLRESFSIVRHNKMFLISSICGFIQVFTPAVDSMLFYRFMMPKMHFRGKEVTGELILLIKNSAVGTPGTFLQPFARQFIQRVGGERNMLLLNSGMGVLQCLLTFIGGYNTFPRLLFMYFLEMLKDIPNKWAPVAKGVIDYEMLDYVEWKTGERSEGVTMSVNALLNKLITSNIGAVTKNGYLQWTGYKGWDFPAEEQPKRFFDTLWPMMWLTGAFDHLVSLVGYSFYRHGRQLRDQVEAELAERRALAERKKEELALG
jgi:Na+/melibiose symporter-like transporter